MGDYNTYDSNPLKLLWDTRKEILPIYLWILWIAIGIILVIGSFINIVDLSNIDSSSFIDLSVSGLSFTLVIVSAAFEILDKEELVYLLEAEDAKEVKGYYFLQVLTPYLFTATVYLIIGMVSIISPLISLDIPDIIVMIFNLSFIMLQLLGIFSLFHITYTILIELYNTVIREKIIKDVMKK